MLSPMMTVLVLAVLWLIVVVPMLVKRNDDRAGERSVARFGRAMRALASRRPVSGPPGGGGGSRVGAGPGVFVAGGPAAAGSGAVPASGGGGSASGGPASRRPVPAAMEAAAYPERVARADQSVARRRMLARRRRSLTLLTLGTLAGLSGALVSGSVAVWLVAAAFLAGLGGYLFFLRNQARRDRLRREVRLQSVHTDYARGYDATENLAYSTATSTVVRIDDDDVELRGIADTVDLTGLYADEEFDERAMRRAV